MISNPATFEQKELPDSSVRLLDKIVNICNENNIRLIFYTVPYEGEYKTALYYWKGDYINHEF